MVHVVKVSYVGSWLPEHCQLFTRRTFYVLQYLIINMESLSFLTASQSHVLSPSSKSFLFSFTMHCTPVFTGQNVLENLFLPAAVRREVKGLSDFLL